MSRWAGPLVVAAILAGIVLILALNIETGGSSAIVAPPGQGTKAAVPEATQTASARDDPNPVTPAPGKPLSETPIGEEYRDDDRHLRIGAVWLPSVEWDGQKALTGSDLIHLEADVKASENNPNGFSKFEFIPYLKIRYTIEPVGGGGGGGGPSLQGELLPMVASDGLHYGATLSMPRAGNYKLRYEVQPPSSGGLGRHSDPLTGVAPWWRPFTASFDWDYQPTSTTPPAKPAG